MDFKSTWRICLVAVIAIAAPCVQAATFYLKLGDIKGESKAAGFEGWVEARSVGMNGAIVGTSFGSMEVNKPVDAATPLLALACVSGKPMREVVIVFPGVSEGGEFRPKAVLKLRDVVIGKVVQLSDNDGGAMEVVSLKYRSILFRYPTVDGDEVAFADLGGGVDTDEDGMGDRYEEYFGFNPEVKDGAEDADGDGLSNYTECRLGLNPRSAGSFFKAGGKVKPSDPSKFNISWEGKPGVEYEIYCTSDLAKPFTFLVRVTAQDFEAGWDTAVSGARGFYQVRPVTE